MTVSISIEAVEKMSAIEKLIVYMNYFVNMVYSKHTDEYYKQFGFDKWKVKTYKEFYDKSNIQINDTPCEDWKERGFASKSWIVLRPSSIYHYVYHSLK